MRKNNYDTLAPIYDFLSRLVYGQSIIKAQRSVLSYIQEGQKILIVGGGTGWILEEMECLKKKNISVTYLEASCKMIQLAQKRKVSFSVDFQCQYAEDFMENGFYDIVLTPFFFDNFRREKCLLILNKLDNLLKNNGLFLWVDFHIEKENNHFFKKGLLKIMYIFFKWMTHIETDQLVNMPAILNEYYETVWQQKHFHNFILAVCYQKNR